jgi:hypothetical protein
MSVPPYRCAVAKLAVAIERERPHDRPIPDRRGRYSRHRLTINTGTAVTRFHDERDIRTRNASGSDDEAGSR